MDYVYLCALRTASTTLSQVCCIGIADPGSFPRLEFPGFFKMTVTLRERKLNSVRKGITS